MSMTRQSIGGETFVRSLVTYIQKEELNPGDRLPSIRSLSEELGIGRNAVRDGLVQAESMGLVRIHPRSGTVVQSPDLSPMMNVLQDTLEAALANDDKNVLHVIEARIAVECESAALAASRHRIEDMISLRDNLQAMHKLGDDRAAFIQADEDFHMGVAKTTGNLVLTTMVRVILVLLRPYRSQYLLAQDSYDATLATHEEVYRRIFDRDVEGASTAMRDHLAHGKNKLLAALAGVSFGD